MRRGRCASGCSASPPRPRSPAAERPGANRGRPRPPQALGVEEAFPRWLVARNTAAFARADWLAGKVRQWPFVPKLALGMILPAGAEGNLVLTLRRAQFADCRGLAAAVVAEAPPPVALDAEPRIAWHVAQSAPAAELTRVLAASSADFVALIDAGDQLAHRRCSRSPTPFSAIRNGRRFTATRRASTGKAC